MKPEEDPEDFEPAGTELVPASGADPVDIYRVLDAHDERMILAELQGKVLDKTLYDFDDGGGRKVDLSFAGVREVIHEMNRTGKCKLRLVPQSLTVDEVIEDAEPHYVADVWAEDLVTGSVFVGTANQPKRMQLKKATAAKWRSKGREVADDDKVWDKFARTKAINKATRNAYGMFVPERIRQTLIAQYLNDPKRIEVIGLAGEADLEELPPPLTDDEMKAKVEQARATWGEIVEVCKGDVARKVNMTPATFHRYATRAETDHARMDDFLAMLGEKLEAAKGGAA